MILPFNKDSPDPRNVVHRDLIRLITSSLFRVVGRHWMTACTVMDWKAKQLTVYATEMSAALKL